MWDKVRAYPPVAEVLLRAFRLRVTDSAEKN